jgi:MscS family membrane protein
VGKRRFLILILSLAALLALSLAGGDQALAIQAEPATPEPAEPAQPTPEGDQNPEPAPEATEILEGVVMTRTPEPTATPGRFEQQVENLVERVGLGQAAFLGVGVVDWLNLAISLLMVLAGYLAGSWLIRAFLPRIVRRTQTTFDDQSLAKIANDVRWLVVLLALQVATSRLTFVRAGLKAFLGDAYFVIGLFLAVLIAFRLIALADDWARRRSMAKDRNAELLEGVTVLLTRVGRLVTTVVGLMILLSHFGVDVTALTAALGLGGLALTLAAQDSIADMIAGIIILFDRPFRVGDRIEIQGANTWGDVLDIGLRTTRIRTRDNRVIILPNSTIGSNQVMNYSYPDRSYRSETHLSVDGDADLGTVRRLIIETIAGVEGVLTDKPIDALYIEMGNYGVIFRVRWWIETYEILRRNLDWVHTALQAAFDEAGIPFASTTQNVKLQADAETVRRISSALQGRRGTDHGAKTDV